MVAVPLTVREAGLFVREHHRHSIPPVGGKFALGCVENGRLAGVAIAGRPVARLLDDGRTLEILRVCTDGTRNANSFLYARVKRIGQLLGYRKIITYTLRKESGASLRAVGARAVAKVRAAAWSRMKRPRRDQLVYWQEKIHWHLLG